MSRKTVEEVKQLMETIQECWRKIHEIRSNCQHVPVRVGDGCGCLECGWKLGWWCPSDDAPYHTCEYSEDPRDEYCIHCGEPSERK